MEVLSVLSSWLRSIVRSRKSTRVLEKAVSSSSSEHKVFQCLIVSVRVSKSEFHIKIKSSMYRDKFSTLGCVPIDLSKYALQYKLAKETEALSPMGIP